MHCDFDSEPNILTFEIDIPYNLYQKMKPIDVEYEKGKNKRTYSVLKPGV